MPEHSEPHARIRLFVVGRPVYPTEIACRPRVVDGTLRVDLEPVLRALGWLLDSADQDDEILVVRRRGARARERRFPRV